MFLQPTETAISNHSQSFEQPASSSPDEYIFRDPLLRRKLDSCGYYLVVYILPFLLVGLGILQAAVGPLHTPTAIFVFLESSIIIALLGRFGFFYGYEGNMKVLEATESRKEWLRKIEHNMLVSAQESQGQVYKFKQDLAIHIADTTYRQQDRATGKVYIYLIVLQRSTFSINICFGMAHLKPDSVVMFGVWIFRIMAALGLQFCGMVEFGWNIRWRKIRKQIRERCSSLDVEKGETGDSSKLLEWWIEELLKDDRVPEEKVEERRKAVINLILSLIKI